MEKVKQISPYYLYYIKGVNGCESNARADLELAIEHLEKALTIKQTEQAFNRLAFAYAKLNDTTMFEKTIIRGSEAGFKAFYSTCGLFYANNKEKANEENL